MPFNYSKLLGRMKELGFIQEKLAKSINISESSLSSKLNNKKYFTSREIEAICRVLDIPNRDIGAYFYSH